MVKIVKNKPELITALTHNLSFVTDEEVNNFLLKKYRLYRYLYRDDDDEKTALEVINLEWHDYIEQLYETTQYEFNPVENYDRMADITDTRTDNLAHGETTTQAPHDWKQTETQTPDDWKTTVNDGGYNSGATVPTSDTVQSGEYKTETEQSGTYVTTMTGNNSGTVTNVHTEHVHGNIGVRSGQELVQQSRDIIIDVLDVYVSKFAVCFTIDI